MVCASFMYGMMQVIREARETWGSASPEREAEGGEGAIGLFISTMQEVTRNTQYVGWMYVHVQLLY